MLLYMYTGELLLPFLVVLFIQSYDWQGNKLLYIIIVFIAVVIVIVSIVIVVILLVLLLLLLLLLLLSRTTNTYCDHILHLCPLTNN